MTDSQGQQVVGVKVGVKLFVWIGDTVIVLVTVKVALEVKVSVGEQPTQVV